jgi:acetyl esterase/lipase
MPWAFLAASLLGAAFTWNAFRPWFRPGPAAVVSFFAGWLTTELALHNLAWQAALAAFFVHTGALRAWPGWLAIGVTALSWSGLVVSIRRSLRARRAVEGALREVLDPIDHEAFVASAPRLDWRQILLPIPVRHRGVERVPGVVYHQSGRLRLRLDVWRPRGGATGAPTLLYVHGGAWILGDRSTQGLPLMQHLAARGWVCFGIDYRLSPRATFPDHLIDVKRAIAWVREHGAEYGADPRVLVVAGGSAGGHLAALAALTANDPALQPGFEHVDTSLSACVPLYGVYDFADRHGAFAHRGLESLLERHVMKVAKDRAREAWDRASPIHLVHDRAPPFLLVHGELDTLVPIEHARHFARALRAASREPVVFAEIPGAQHAFEIFP